MLEIEGDVTIIGPLVVVPEELGKALADRARRAFPTWDREPLWTVELPTSPPPA